MEPRRHEAQLPGARCKKTLLVYGVPPSGDKLNLPRREEDTLRNDCGN